MVIIKIEHNQPQGWVEGADFQQLRQAIKSADFGGEYQWLGQWLEEHEYLSPGYHKITEHFWLLV